MYVGRTTKGHNHYEPVCLPMRNISLPMLCLKTKSLPFISLHMAAIGNGITMHPKVTSGAFSSTLLLSRCRIHKSSSQRVEACCYGWLTRGSHLVFLCWCTWDCMVVYPFDPLTCIKDDRFLFLVFLYLQTQEYGAMYPFDPLGRIKEDHFIHLASSCLHIQDCRAVYPFVPLGWVSPLNSVEAPLIWYPQVSTDEFLIAS